MNQDPYPAATTGSEHTKRSDLRAARRASTWTGLTAALAVAAASAPPSTRWSYNRAAGCRNGYVRARAGSFVVLVVVAVTASVMPAHAEPRHANQTEPVVFQEPFAGEWPSRRTELGLGGVCPGVDPVAVEPFCRGGSTLNWRTGEFGADLGFDRTVQGGGGGGVERILLHPTGMTAKQIYEQFDHVTAKLSYHASLDSAGGGTRETASLHGQLLLVTPEDGYLRYLGLGNTSFELWNETAGSPAAATQAVTFPVLPPWEPDLHKEAYLALRIGTRFHRREPAIVTPPVAGCVPLFLCFNTGVYAPNLNKDGVAVHVDLESMTLS